MTLAQTFSVLGIDQIPANVQAVTNNETYIHAWIEGRELVVYRSLIVYNADEMFRPVRELVGDAEPTFREVITDPDMMFGRAEHLRYPLGGQNNN